MSDPEHKPARLEFKTSDLSFSGEGDPVWLAAQLDKVLAALRELARKA
jgi:hypothetical protein